MAAKFFSYTYLVYFLFFILMLMGVLFGRLSFGLGLGDIGLLLVSFVLLILGGIGVYYRLKIGHYLFGYWNIFVGLLYLGILIYLILSLTVLRGVENPWNGSVFIK